LSEVERERDTALAGQRFVQERLDAIIGGLRDGVILVDSELRIVSVNAAAGAMMRSAPGAAVGKPLVEISRDADLVRIAQDAIQHRVAQTTPVDYRRAGRQFNVRVQPIHQAGRRMAILVVQDITELRQLEKVRRDFVSNVSHELRTPLAAIRALVETLADGAIDDETVAEDFLRRVISEVDRLNELIEDLLDLGRLESGRLPLRRSRISAAELVRRSVDRVLPQANEAKVGIRIDDPGEEVVLSVDVSRIEQVLINLLDNAIKFSPHGVDVSVTWEKAGGGVEIAVIDRGSGIAPEELPRIFERFYKSDRARNSSGTGLGLAIARHIMAAHGGDLSVESVYGEGATFTAKLPESAISDDLSEDPARPESRLPEC
jgi:two-component system phosphate regulon sensor histidine kinase PhoR